MIISKRAKVRLRTADGEEKVVLVASSYSAGYGCWFTLLKADGTAEMKSFYVSSTSIVSVEQVIDHAARLLYMVEHEELGVRKVGITRAERLDTWRQRRWSVVEIIEYDNDIDLRAAEAQALHRLDQCGARATTKMEALFPNLDENGRTEMYDPALFEGGLDELLSDWMGIRLGDREPIVPEWIARPRRNAAKKAWEHPNLARRRVLTNKRDPSMNVAASERSSS